MQALLTYIIIMAVFVCGLVLGATMPHDFGVSIVCGAVIGMAAFEYVWHASK